MKYRDGEEELAWERHSKFPYTNMIAKAREGKKEQRRRQREGEEAKEETVREGRERDRRRRELIILSTTTRVITLLFPPTATNIHTHPKPTRYNRHNLPPNSRTLPLYMQ